MPTYRASDTKFATVTLTNPNPVSLPVTVSIKIGNDGTASKTRTITPNGSADFKMAVKMPSDAGAYQVTVPVKYNGASVTYKAGSIQIYKLQEPTISFDWGTIGGGGEVE